MKAIHLFFLLGLIFFAGTVFAQKPPIDSAAIASWPELSNPAISNDGRYFLYTINNVPVGERSLIIRPALKDGIEKKFVVNGDGQFTPNSKNAVITLRDDTLAFYHLETGQVRKIPGIASHTLSAKGWLACLDKSAEARLSVYDPALDKVQRVTGVNWYNFDPQGHCLLLKQNTGTDSTKLSLFYPASGKMQTVYRGSIGTAAFDETGEKIAFFSDSKENGTKLYVYHLDNSSVQLLADNLTKGIGDNAVIDANGELFFNNIGDRLFFKLRIDSIAKPKPGYIKVNVWNYKDATLQPIQLANNYPKTSFLAVYNLDKGNLVRIETPDRVIAAGEGVDTRQLPYYTSPYVVVKPPKGTDPIYRIKTRSLEPVLYRLSMDNGNITPIPVSLRFSILQKNTFCAISPTGRFMLYFNEPKRTWYSYDTETGLTKNISGRIPVSMSDEYYADGPTLPYWRPAGIAGWTKGDSAVLINDTYDIWKVDPLAHHTPVNLMSGYGQKHHIRFRLAQNDNSIGLPFVNPNELLLAAFDPLTKYNGFYKASILKSAAPTLLTMGPFCYAHQSFQVFAIAGGYHFFPVKAGDTALWVVGRCTTNEAPNYYLTADFKSLEPLTDLEPQKQYNWMTSELVNYTLPDGRPSQGLLLKPENFDPKKKYPIIFNFYMRLSDLRFNYFIPEFSGGQIDYPYYVSRGYLVFLMDMHYKANAPGPSVVGSIESAVRYLEKTRPFIDSTKMAINGESWGGYEVNYLVTHTHNFAAAAECCGVSDMISDYGIGSFNSHYRYETLESYNWIDVNPWQRLDVYLKNSPILSADKVTTPLLILHGEQDRAVPFSHSIELFTALFELGKPSWMLQYDNTGHGVWTLEDRIDFTKRLSQFFDHYLNGAPPPVWMTRGVPASLKGIDSGLEYDLSGAKP